MITMLYSYFTGLVWDEYDVGRKCMSSRTVFAKEWSMDHDSPGGACLTMQISQTSLLAEWLRNMNQEVQLFIDDTNSESIHL